MDRNKVHVLNSQFRAHGYCDIHTKDNIIYIDAYGPWNKEYFDNLHQRLAGVVTEVDRDNFAVYLCPIGEAIAMKDGLEQHKMFLEHSKVKAVAINLNQCATKFLTKKLCVDIYASQDITHEFFTEKQIAINWLRGFLD